MGRQRPFTAGWPGQNSHEEPHVSSFPNLGDLKNMGFSFSYHLVMTNIAMENPNHKWRFLAGKIIYKWAMASMAMLNNQSISLVDNT